MEAALPETDGETVPQVGRLQRHQARLTAIYDHASFVPPYDDGMAAGALRLWLRLQKRIEALEGTDKSDETPLCQ